MTYQPPRRDVALRRRSQGGGVSDPMEARIMMERVLASRGEYAGFVWSRSFLSRRLNFAKSIEQMKKAIAAVDGTSDYVRGEIARKKAIHNKDVADLIKHEHGAYYQKVFDSSLAYDDLALHDDRGLEKVRGPSTSFLSYLITVGAARGFNHSRNKRFSAAGVTTVLPARCGPIMGETGQDPINRGRTTASLSFQVPNDRHGLPCHPRHIPPTPYLSVPYAARQDSRQGRAEKQEGRDDVDVSVGLEAGYSPL